MDIKNIIAQASAAHMNRVACAVDELIASVEAARASGFEVRLKAIVEEGSDPRLTPTLDAVAANLVGVRFKPTLHYSVSIMESEEV